MCLRVPEKHPTAALLSRSRESLAYFIPGCLLAVVSPCDAAVPRKWHRFCTGYVGALRIRGMMHVVGHAIGMWECQDSLAVAADFGPAAPSFFCYVVDVCT